MPSATCASKVCDNPLVLLVVQIKAWVSFRANQIFRLLGAGIATHPIPILLTILLLLGLCSAGWSRYTYRKDFAANSIPQHSISMNLQARMMNALGMQPAFIGIIAASTDGSNILNKATLVTLYEQIYVPLVTVAEENVTFDDVCVRTGVGSCKVGSIYSVWFNLLQPLLNDPSIGTTVFKHLHYVEPFLGNPQVNWELQSVSSIDALMIAAFLDTRGDNQTYATTLERRIALLLTNTSIPGINIYYFTDVCISPVCY